MAWFALQKEKKEKRELEELLEKLGIKKSNIVPEFEVKVHHEIIKEVAKDMLRKLGFEDKQIKEEYTVRPSNKKWRWRIDVVGISKEHKTAVECGKYNPTKVLELMKIFDDVYLLDLEAKAIRVGPELLELFVNWLKERVGTETEESS